MWHKAKKKLNLYLFSGRVLHRIFRSLICVIALL